MIERYDQWHYNVIASTCEPFQFSASEQKPKGDPNIKSLDDWSFTIPWSYPIAKRCCVEWPLLKSFCIDQTSIPCSRVMFCGMIVCRPGTNNPTGFRTWVNSTLRVASQRSNQFGQRVRPADERLAGRLGCAIPPFSMAPDTPGW